MFVWNFASFSVRLSQTKKSIVKIVFKTIPEQKVFNSSLVREEEENVIKT